MDEPTIELRVKLKEPGEALEYSMAHASDLIVRNDKGHFHVNKIILRIWSPFFNRVFKSAFGVAQSDTFELEENENLDAFEEMIKYMYGYSGYDTLRKPSYGDMTKEQLRNRLEYCIAVFAIADKYDCPCLRKEVFLEFYRILWKYVYFWDKFDLIIPLIMMILGPDRDTLADGSFHDELCSFCEANHYQLSENDRYAAVFGNGDYFDELTLTTDVHERRAGTRWQSLYDDSSDDDSYRDPEDNFVFYDTEEEGISDEEREWRHAENAESAERERAWFLQDIADASGWYDYY